MKNYDTLSEAIKNLQDRGYTCDFNFKHTCLECPSKKVQVFPEDFEVDEFYRFEGMSSTDDNSILFAISTSNGLKGTLVDAYGVYAESLSQEMLKKFR